VRRGQPVAVMLDQPPHPLQAMLVAGEAIHDGVGQLARLGLEARLHEGRVGALALLHCERGQQRTEQQRAQHPKTMQPPQTPGHDFRA